VFVHGCMSVCVCVYVHLCARAIVTPVTVELAYGVRETQT